MYVVSTYDMVKTKKGGRQKVRRNRHFHSRNKIKKRCKIRRLEQILLYVICMYHVLVHTCMILYNTYKLSLSKKKKKNICISKKKYLVTQKALKV